MVGVWWDGNPISFALSLPFSRLWFEHDGGKYVTVRRGPRISVFIR